MLLNWSPIVEIFINPKLQSIDLIIQAITTTSLHHGRKKTRCVYLHPTDLLRDHNMSLTETTIRNLKQTSRLHSKTRRKTQNFIVNLLLQMKRLLLSVQFQKHINSMCENENCKFTILKGEFGLKKRVEICHVFDQKASSSNV
jgi:hypothetical protein